MAGGPIKAYGKVASLVMCEFWPDTANDPSTYRLDDEVTSVVHTATGQWTVQLRNQHRKVSVVGLVLGLATPGMNGLTAQVDNEGSATAPSVLVSYCSSGTTLADIAADDDNRIALLLYIEDGEY